MKPLPAVGLASAIIQIVDFSIKITQKEHKIYQPAEGNIVENHAVLQAVAHNLFRLSLKLDQNDLRRLASEKRGRLSEPAEMLLKLADDAKELTAPLTDAVLQAQAHGTFGDPKWQTVREALSTIWKKKDITGIKKKLKNVRKEVETALLIALQQYLDQSAETGLPVFSEEDGRLHHIERWQNEAMDAIHSNKWKPKNKKHAEEFTKIVDKLILAGNEAVFFRDVFTRLHFPVMDDRFQSIAVAHEGTLEWAFDEWVFDVPGGDQQEHEGNLMKWFGDKSGKNLFWITGKPGSGKSTLMKHLFRNPRLFPHLEAWSGASPGIIAGFFFWSCGTELQNSNTGMLRALLYESLQDMIYGPLQKDPYITQRLFADRWQQFASYGGGTTEYTFAELRHAFDAMISDTTKKFLFFVDGIDEMDGYPEVLVDLLLASTKRDNVKICMTGRPLPGFLNAFHGRPSLVVDLMTSNDIQHVVTQQFNQNENLVRIRTQQNDSKLESNLIREIVSKAAGGFLWATLSTDYLLRGVSASDVYYDLQLRADGLPAELEELIPRIFQNIDGNDRTQAARLFRLIHAHGYPTLLGLSFANDNDPTSSLAADIQSLKAPELTKRVEQMYAVTSNQCRNFLTIFESASEIGDDEERNPAERLRVNFAHQVIRDVLISEPTWSQILQTTGLDAFDTDENWANGSLWTLKTLTPHTTPEHSEFLSVWDDLAWCIEYALRLEEKDKKVRARYLDEVGRAAVTSRQSLIALNATDLPEGAIAETFLDVAVWLNLTGYVSVRAKTSKRNENKHAVEYFTAVRKRLGDGGEERWLAGKRRMKALYRESPTELHMLLAYYSKAVKFGSAKPNIEIPEAV